jgi:hypothetical protein
MFKFKPIFCWCLFLMANCSDQPRPRSLEIPQKKWFPLISPTVFVPRVLRDVPYTIKSSNQGGSVGMRGEAKPALLPTSHPWQPLRAVSTCFQNLWAWGPSSPIQIPWLWAKATPACLSNCPFSPASEICKPAGLQILPIPLEPMYQKC